jgi:uncharacterized FAD-dependent dehydrogenase
MIRLSEIKLPLTEAEHPEPALRAACARLLGVAPDAITSLCVFKRSFDARKAELMAVYIVDLRLAARRRGGAARAIQAAPPRRPHARHGLAPAGARPGGPAAAARWWWASGPAAFLRRCCWRKWAFARSCWSAANRCASAPRTPGACGARTCCKPESNVQFGEGGAGTFSDGKLYSQIKDPRHLGRKVMHEFVKAGRTG